MSYPQCIHGQTRLTGPLIENAMRLANRHVIVAARLQGLGQIEHLLLTTAPRELSVDLRNFHASAPRVARVLATGSRRATLSATCSGHNSRIQRQCDNGQRSGPCAWHGRQLNDATLASSQATPYGEKPSAGVVGP